MKVLIVSPFFYPYAGVGGNRMTSLAEFLIKDNHEVTILKNSDQDYKDSLVYISKYDKCGFNTVEVSHGNNFKCAKKKYKSALRDLITCNKFDVIIISIGPYYTLPLVKIVKNKCDPQTKVILDIRDYWAHEPNIKASLLDKIKSHIKDFVYMNGAIKGSDKIVVCCEGARGVLRDHYERFNAYNKSVSILNGHEVTCTIKNSFTKKDTNIYNCYIFGKFVYDKSLRKLVEEFFVAIQKLDKINIQIVQIGNHEEELKGFCEKYGINYKCTGYISHEKGIDLMNSDADILIGTMDLKIGFGTKLFDYIALRKPILYMCDKDSEIASLLYHLPSAYACANCNDVIYAFKDIVFAEKTSFSSNIDSYQFSRENQNKKYCNLIKACGSNY